MTKFGCWAWMPFEIIRSELYAGLHGMDVEMDIESQALLAHMLIIVVLDPSSNFKVQIPRAGRAPFIMAFAWFSISSLFVSQTNGASNQISFRLPGDAGPASLAC